MKKDKKNKIQAGLVEIKVVHNKSCGSHEEGKKNKICNVKMKCQF